MQKIVFFKNPVRNVGYRVLFLTKGVWDSGGILQMATTYKEMGITLSSIGLGTDFDGNLVSDRYILTGTVIEMVTSMVIFGRIINVESCEIESFTYIIVDTTKHVSSLL